MKKSDCSPPKEKEQREQKKKEKVNCSRKKKKMEGRKDYHKRARPRPVEELKMNYSEKLA